MPDAPDAPPPEPAAPPREQPRFTRTQLARAGAAVGVGSAALIAALLYAKSRQKETSARRVRHTFTD